MARAFYAPVLADPRRPAKNARFVYLDLASRDFFTDWERAAGDIAAMLRSEAGHNPHDKQLIELIGELSTRSEDFRNRWAAHNVRFHRTGSRCPDRWTSIEAQVWVATDRAERQTLDRSSRSVLLVQHSNRSENRTQTGGSGALASDQLKSLSVTSLAPGVRRIAESVPLGERAGLDILCAHEPAFEDRLMRRCRSGGAAPGTQHDVVDMVRSRGRSRRTEALLVKLDVPCR